MSKVMRIAVLGDLVGLAVGRVVVGGGAVTVRTNIGDTTATAGTLTAGGIRLARNNGRVGLDADVDCRAVVPLIAGTATRH
jgi:hypothetical protein